MDNKTALKQTLLGLHKTAKSSNDNSDEPSPKDIEKAHDYNQNKENKKKLKALLEGGAIGAGAGLGTYGLYDAVTGNAPTVAGAIGSGLAGAGLGAAAKYFSPKVQEYFNNRASANANKAFNKSAAYDPSQDPEEIRLRNLVNSAKTQVDYGKYTQQYKNYVNGKYLASSPYANVAKFFQRYTPGDNYTAPILGGTAGLGAYGLYNALSGNKASLAGTIGAGLFGSGLGYAAKYFSPKVQEYFNNKAKTNANTASENFLKTPKKKVPATAS